MAYNPNYQVLLDILSLQLQILRPGAMHFRSGAACIASVCPVFNEVIQYHGTGRLLIKNFLSSCKRTFFSVHQNS
jgi:hypothetical protein